MKAVVRFSDATKGCTLLDNIPLKPPHSEHVLIKVMATPVNPCDECFCAGKFAPHGKCEPFACGYEGSGIIVNIGENVPKELIGKRVAFYRALKYTEGAFGVWCQFATLHYSTCVVLDDNMSFEDTCGILINPMTVFGLLEIIKKKCAKVVVNTAAASALGKMLVSVCKEEGIDVICIIRRKEQVKTLEELGAKYILNQSNPNFDAEFKDLAHKLNCKIALEAVGGDLTARIMNCMPPKSRIYVYGDLAGEFKSLHPNNFMLCDVTLKGFVLSKTEVYNNKEVFQIAAKRILDDIRKGGLKFKTNVVKKYKLEEYKKALEEYRKYATAGKAVICPNIDN